MPEASRRPAGLSLGLNSPGKNGAVGAVLPQACASRAWLGQGGTDRPHPQHWREEGAGAGAAEPDVTSRCQHSIDPLEEISFTHCALQLLKI